MIELEACRGDIPKFLLCDIIIIISFTFTDHPMFSAAEMTSEHELQESGNLGETQRNPSLKNGRLENFGSSKDPNLAGTLIFSFQPVKKQVQNA